MGCKLFDRTSNRVALNANGRRLQKSLYVVFSELDGAVAELSANTGDDREIKMLVRGMRRDVTKLITEFNGKHPHVAFKTVFDFRDADLSGYDIIIDEKSNRYPEYKELPLFNTGLRLKCAVGHPLCGRKLTLRQLSNQKFISMGEDSNMHKILTQACKRAGFAPDIAIGTGGYVCGPVLRQAARLGVPVLLHESNALPGVTVKLLAADAAAVMVANEEAAARLPKGTRAVVTGNPLRRELTATDKETARRELGVDDRPLVLCFGGSLGARRLNEAVAGVLARNQAEGCLQFLVGTGRGENYETMQRFLREKGVEPDGVHVRVRDYIDDMPRCMAAADLVICRCGAMTLSELPALGKPSILVPSPNVAENHQYYNAMALASRGAAVCVQESELTEERLWHEVSKTALAPDVLARMGAAARQAAVLDADERILAVIRQTLTQHTR